MSNFSGSFFRGVADALIGRKIKRLVVRESVGVQYPVLLLEGGFEVAVMSDDEGNGGGVLAIEACPVDFAKVHGLK